MISRANPYSSGACVWVMSPVCITASTNGTRSFIAVTAALRLSARNLAISFLSFMESRWVSESWATIKIQAFLVFRDLIVQKS